MSEQILVRVQNQTKLQRIYVISSAWGRNDEESAHLADREELIGKTTSLRAETSYSQ